MDVDSLARRGRIALWGLVFFMAGPAFFNRFVLPTEWFLGVTRLVAGDYAAQELVLMQTPWTDGLHRLLGLALLVAGMLQFHPGLRRARPRIHRWTGRAFLLIAAAVGATGLVLAITVPFSGPAETALIALAAVLLLWFAARAWSAARRRRFAEHREWTIRALGLAFFVALQRLYYVPLWLLTGGPERELFLAATALSIVTVLAAAETWVHLTRRTRPAPPQERTA